jgi:hypothetical protein
MIDHFNPHLNGINHNNARPPVIYNSFGLNASNYNVSIESGPVYLAYFDQTLLAQADSPQHLGGKVGLSKLTIAKHLN